MAEAAPFAVFRVAAGARIGYGHLRRATVLARCLRRRCVVSVRGGGRVPAEWREAPGSARAALSLRPQVLIVDDPRAVHALPWVRAAQRLGIVCVSVHDLGLAPVPSDLAVDGSLQQSSHRLPARDVLRGPAYAVIDVPRTRERRVRPATGRPRILVNFGGGDHLRLLAATVDALCARLPQASLIVPTGLDPRRGAWAGQRRVSQVRPVAAPDGLAPWLRRVDLAILGGGVSLYEAAALGVPVVTTAVVDAQRPTVQAFRRAGVARAVARGTSSDDTARRIARRVGDLWHDVQARAEMSARGPRTVDGQGARRVARALLALTERRRA